MKSVYFNQNGMWVYVSSVKKTYEIGDVVRLKWAHYPLRVVKINNDDIYCELIKE